MGGIGLRSDRGPILVAVLLSVSLIAIDTTVIATAVPSVVRDLGGLSQFPWLFSVYLLAQAATVPIYSKLADQYGRKPIMLVGIGLFLLGSILCGAAWSMPALIVSRAVQGFGAGAVAPMAMTIVGDVYSLAERARVQGYLASVWGVSSVVGPAIGGVFSEWVSWRWIFFVNVPLCVLAGVMLLRGLQERVEPRRHRLDYAGSVLLAGGCALLILGLLEGGVSWAWSSAQSALVLGGGAVLVGAFVLVECRAAEPVLPGWVFRRRVLNSANAVALLVGAVMIGLTSYVPAFLQESLGLGPLAAGFAFATLTIGWPISATLSGRVYLRIGFRSTALIGAALTAVGALLVSLADTAAYVAAACFVVGFGLGFVAGPALISAQTTVGWAERGVVTGTNMFARSIGSGIGVAIFGAIANASLDAGLDRAAGNVFVAVFASTLLLLAAVATMPKVVESVEAEPAAAAA